MERRLFCDYETDEQLNKMCDILVKLLTLILFFLLEIFLFLLVKLRKHFHNVTHTLQLPQLCEPEDFDSSKKFIHLIGPTIEQSQ